MQQKECRNYAASGVSQTPIVINKGKVEAVGTHGKLLNVCPLYRNMWNAHIVAKDDDSVDLVHLKKTGGEAANA